MYRAAFICWVAAIGVVLASSVGVTPSSEPITLAHVFLGIALVLFSGFLGGLAALEAVGYER